MISHGKFDYQSIIDAEADEEIMNAIRSISKHKEMEVPPPKVGKLVVNRQDRSVFEQDSF